MSLRDSLSSVQRHVAESVARPASPGTTVARHRAPDMGVITAPGGTGLNRYDFGQQAEYVAGRYGRLGYGSVRYRVVV